MRGAWELPERRSLLRNNCDGTFTDVTDASGLARPSSKSQTAVWTDVNNDGFLDLFVGNEDTRSQLFLNKKDGTFEDVAHAAGVDRLSFAKAVSAGDYDNDGWPDLYVSNLGGGNYLYHNNRDGTFTEVGARCRCARTWTVFWRVVLRLRQRRVAGPVRHQLLRERGRHRCARTSACRTTHQR